MICPKCAAVCDDDLRYCDHCGLDLSAPFPGEDSVLPEIPVIQVVEKPAIPACDPGCPAAVPAPVSTPQPKKGRLWPPLVFLALMIVTGTLLFFLIPSGSGNTSMPWFTVEHGTLYFHPELYHGSRELEIPETVNGQKISAIGDYAFSGAENITTVILPDSLVRIGDYAFSGCKNIRGLFIPDSVRSIGTYAFADCDKLEAIYLPGTLETLGHDALSSCNSLHYIIFDGTYSQWASLYNGYFISSVELHTIDGIYYTSP